MIMAPTWWAFAGENEVIMAPTWWALAGGNEVIMALSWWALAGRNEVIMAPYLLPSLVALCSQTGKKNDYGTYLVGLSRWE